MLGWIGVDLTRPLVTQVSRFDPWKDPFGVIAAYRLAKEQVPEVQLALVGSMAFDDPQGWSIYAELERAARDDPDLHLFTNLTGVGNIEVNAFQRLSDVVVQKSIREGFGLVVSETLWKGTPVVAGRAGGIPLQLREGVGGFLVESIDECAARVVELLQNPDEGAALGNRGTRPCTRTVLVASPARRRAPPVRGPARPPAPEARRQQRSGHRRRNPRSRLRHAHR